MSIAGAVRLAAACCLIGVFAPAYGWEALTSGGRPLTVEATPVDVEPDATAAGVSHAGAWRLASDDPGFGGLSGLLLDEGRLLSVGDRGAWLTAQLVLSDTALRLEAARMAPLLGGDGVRLDAAGSDFADAEGLTKAGEAIVVSFERVHRAIVFGPDGAPERVLRDRRFEFFAHNGGLEALATLPDGGILAIVEDAEADGFPQFVLRPGVPPLEGRLAAPSRHAVTGADIGPDGRLYVVFRHWSRETGTSIRLRRYDLAPDGLTRSDTMEDLAGWEADSGVDNMEGLAVVGEGGALAVWLIADDNFNAPAQRTLLLRLAVAP